MLRECDGARLTAMLVWGMDEVLLWMCAVRGMKGIGGVCEMCMCVARGAWVESG